jgi:hypothetical protein
MQYTATGSELQEDGIAIAGRLADGTVSVYDDEACLRYAQTVCPGILATDGCEILALVAACLRNAE